MEFREEPDEIQDLPGRAYGFPENEGSKSWCEMSKILLDVWHEVGYSELAYSKFLEVCKCGKVMQGGSVKLFGSEGITECVEMELLDERKQTEVI